MIVHDANSLFSTSPTPSLSVALFFQSVSHTQMCPHTHTHFAELVENGLLLRIMNSPCLDLFRELVQM